MDDNRPRRRGSRGPRPKGDREQRNLNFERPVLAMIDALAASEGLAPGDVTTRLCAEGLGLPVPPYCLPRTSVPAPRFSTDVRPRRRGSRGPLPKGDRVARAMKLEKSILAEVDVRASLDGLTPSDVVTRLCAEQLGLPVPPYCLPRLVTQEELPMAEAI